MTEVWRQFAMRLARALGLGAGAFLLVVAAGAVVIYSLYGEVQSLRDQGECRSNIAASAEVIRVKREDAQSRFVIAAQRRGGAQAEAREAQGAMALAADEQARTRATEALTNANAEAARQLTVGEEAVDEMERQSARLGPAMDLRERAVPVCTENPNFKPPPS